MTRLPILVIGGGVAGSACALRLRQHDIEVVVVEKAVFPRAKVCGCCLGSGGLEMLSRLGLGGWVTRHAVPIERWYGSMGGHTIRLELPGGAAISRESLDTRMLAATVDAGAEVIAPAVAEVRAISDGCVTATMESNDGCEQRDFAVAIIASGLNASGMSLGPSWNERPNGPFGASFSAECESIEPGVIYMACDNDGYVGLVKLENNRVDVAAALHSGAAAASRGAPAQRIDAILNRSAFPALRLADRSPMMATPPLRRARGAGQKRVLRIGDAAGYVEPFTGEGMTWAMQSGIAAADRIAASIDRLDEVGDGWDRELDRLLGRKRRTCRALTTVLRWPLARQAAASTLARWPGAARPLVRSLNRV